MSKQSKGKASSRKRIHSDSEEDSRRGSSQEIEDDQEAAREEALNEAQLRALNAEKLAQERDEEIRTLKAKLKERESRNAKRPNRASGSGRGAANRQPERPVNRPSTPQAAAGANADQQALTGEPARSEELLGIENNKRYIRTAGRCCCVLHHPFMEPDFLTDNAVRQALPQIIQDLENKLAGAAEPGPDAEDEHQGANEGYWAATHFKLAQPVDIVREILSTLPIELGKLWLSPSFQSLFHTGYRKMRSEAVSAVAEARLIIFKMTEEEFGGRSDVRNRGAAAQALFENSKYMLAPAAPDAQGVMPPKSPRWFRHDCLVNACQVILSGLSAAENASDKPSTKARKSRGAIWGVTGVTPSILAFTLIVVHFVLSGDPEFLGRSRSTDFTKLWDKQMDLLQKHHQKARTDYDGMGPNQDDAVVLGEEEREFEAELDG
ncbi:hypothetical protein FRC06_009777 [Ceratobasidium sp. 370]|nr:hypothetical protein FRC06_009777 [Ceratobasidium sp. 370]